jgi:nitrite reductase/ring-hydroxylating ferredoxin subunit
MTFGRTAGTMRRMDADGWTRVISLEDLEEEELNRVDLDGAGVLLFRLEDRILAVSARCTHQGMPLDDADVQINASDVIITCPAHGSRFQLSDGRVVRSPAAVALPSYDARVTDGGVEIRPRA